MMLFNTVVDVTIFHFRTICNRYIHFQEYLHFKSYRVERIIKTGTVCIMIKEHTDQC